MARASFLTPVYFFSSIRAGSGKASLVAGLSVFLNNLKQKIALIDLDGEMPLKLRSTFPQSIILQEYPEISQAVKAEENRFQKNFYFTETTQISYFPAHRLADPSLLFSDTSMRDFFIQLKASFDCVFINFPAGFAHCQKVSDLLARQHLWRGSRPASLIVSQSDEKSLICLDKLLQQNPALSYQLQENTWLVFNRVPASPEDQKLAESILNGSELRKIFDNQQTYIIPVNEEFPKQRLEAWPTVLKTDSLMHQTISALNRLLNAGADSPLRFRGQQTGDFQACLDGELLEKLSPYLEKVHQATAARLFIHPSELQVFLEEGSGNYRIRIRISGVTQPLVGINPKLRQEPECKVIQRASPPAFAPKAFNQHHTAVNQIEKNAVTGMAMRPVYKFEDCFVTAPESRLQPEMPLLPEKDRQPSPILFKLEPDLPEVPSLSHVLGYATRKYRQYNFTACEKFCEIGGVTHFFIPPEFQLFYTLPAIFQENLCCIQAVSDRTRLTHWIEFEPAYEWIMPREEATTAMPDEFARNRPFVPENDFLTRPPPDPPAEYGSVTLPCSFFPYDSSLFPVPYNFTLPGETVALTTPPVPPQLPLMLAKIAAPEEEQEKETIETGTRLTSFLARDYASFAVTSEAVRAAFVEARASEVSVKMPASYLFELDPFTSPQPTAPEFISTFQSITAGYPQNLPADLSAVSGSEKYISPHDTKLPASFAIEDLMMEYVYATHDHLPLKKDFLISARRAKKPLRPAMSVFFRQTFPESQFENIVDPLAAQRQNLAHCFLSAGYGFRSLNFTQIAAPKSHVFDLLHVKFKPGRDLASRDSADATIYRSDRLVDNSLKQRQLPPCRARMLEILAPASNQLKSSQKPVTGRLKASFTSLPAYPAVVLTRSFSSSVISRSCHLDRLPVDLFSGYRPALTLKRGRHTTAAQITRKAWKNEFSIDELLLTTLSMRQELRRFHNFPGPGIDLRIDCQPVIPRRCFPLSSIPARPFTWEIRHAMPPLPRSLPLRHRRVENPKISDVAAKKLALRIECDLKNIIWQAGKIRTEIFEIAASQTKQEHRKPETNRRYPFAVSAQKHFRGMAQKQINFFVRPPQPLEMLFEHLRHILKTMRTSGQEFSEAALNSRSAYAGEQFTCQEKTEHVKAGFGERNTTVYRMPQSQQREKYLINKLRLRDLMNLARQTNQKLQEINQKISA